MRLTKRQTDLAKQILLSAKYALEEAGNRPFPPTADHGLCFYITAAYAYMVAHTGMPAQYYADLALAEGYLIRWIEKMLEGEKYLGDWLWRAHAIRPAPSNRAYRWTLYNTRVQWLQYMIDELLNPEK